MHPFVSIYRCQVRTVRLEPASICTHAYNNLFIERRKTKRSCIRQYVLEFQTARVLVHISKDHCNGLCLLSLFDGATSGALFQTAVSFASRNEVLQRLKVARKSFDKFHTRLFELCMNACIGPVPPTENLQRTARYALNHLLLFLICACPITSFQLPLNDQINHKLTTPLQPSFTSSNNLPILSILTNRPTAQPYNKTILHGPGSAQDGQNI